MSGCVACDRPHTADNYVCCDKCDKWWHFSCAGVTASIANRDWICSRCLPVQNTLESISVTSARSGTPSQKLRHEQYLARLAEQQKLERQQMLKEHELQKRHLEEKHQLMILREESENRSARSGRSVVSSSTRTNQWVLKHAEEPITTAANEGAVGGTTTSIDNLPATQSLPKPVDQTGQSVTPEFTEPSLVEKLREELKLREEESQQQIQALQAQFTLLQVELQQHKQPNQPTPITTNKGAVPKVSGNISGSTKQSLFQINGVNWEISPVENTISKPITAQICKETRNSTRFKEQSDGTFSLLNHRWSTAQEQPGNFAGGNKRIDSVNIGKQNIPNVPFVPEQLRSNVPSGQESNNSHTVPLVDPPKIFFTPGRNHARSEQSDFHHRVAAEQIQSQDGAITRFGPSQEQLAARQVLPRDLPVFTGDPADWPVFISNYNYTTEACGYSNGENMIRLQRCLKGIAWECVRSRLILPASVPQVIESLTMRFGRPEILIEEFVEKVKSTPIPRADKLETMIDFGTMVQGLCDHIVAANLQEHLANPTLLEDLVAKLPAEYKMKWAGYRNQSPTVNLKTFSMFMEGIVEDAYSVSSFNASERLVRREKQRRIDQSFVHADNEECLEEIEIKKRPVDSAGIECLICRKYGHRAKECRVFWAMSIDERWKTIQSKAICRTCLFGHGRRSCRSTTRCGDDGCQYRHHPLLHSPSSVQAAQRKSQTEDHHVHQDQLSKLLFRIVPVTLYGRTGSIDTFAFLDEGSSLTMIESSLADNLEVNGYDKPLCLKWTSNVTREEKQSRRVTFEISGIGKMKRYWLNDVGTIQSLDLPVQTLPINDMKLHYQHLQGIPIEGYRGAVPRLLIGIDNLKLTLPLKTREGEEGNPVAVKTRLGWCVYGGQRNARFPSVNMHICECNRDESMDETIKTYFSIEEVGARPRNECMSKEDQRALKILQETTVSVGDRFESGLLWKFDDFEFPDSYPMAIKRLHCLQRGMEKDPTLKENIQRQIQEYIDKGYAHRASVGELAAVDPRRIWFLPLGAVVNPKKPSKVRLIWDASAKVDGVSLNGMLLKGPDQLASLPTVIFHFRQHQVAVVGDIREMFHQIFIRWLDRYSQCFLWSPDSSHDPEIFVMDVATFGSTSSPATAQFVKNTNAQRFAQEFTRAVEGILYNHYVDDYLDSFPDEEEAKRVATAVREVHRRGGFEIRNWCSNSPAVLKHLGENAKKVEKNLNLENAGTPERVLGMLWNSEEDVIHFETTMRENIRKIIEYDTIPTKRQILQCVMTLFDPLGLLTPYLIFGRILIQDVWRAGTKWDELVDNNIFQRWRDWVKILYDINKVRVPRCYFRPPDSFSFENVQLHVFVDASPTAYSCACYFHIINAQGEVEVSLVAAKAKVAPLKHMSIPRLELQACVLGSRMMKLVVDGHTFSISKRYSWTDSQTAHTWINKDPHIYRPFVAHRVAEILETTKREEWRWLRSELNPADEATKWGVGPYFNSESTWFSGPKFLRFPESQWPHSIPDDSGEEELRSCYTHQEIHASGMIIDVKRSSSWSRLQRTMAYVHRFVTNSHKAADVRDVGHLTQSELQKAEITLFKMTQWESYPEEMAMLTGSGNTVERTSSIYQFTPKVDKQGVLRVDGRIGAAKRTAYGVKFPVILPQKHHVTNLILEDLHRKFKHGYNETVVNEARQQFCIPYLRRVVRNISNRCLLCRMRKACPVVPQMAPLPEARLSPFVRPFTYVGVDYFGPILVRRGRCHEKRWVALFTCLTIRAIHVEVVYSLTTEAFIMSVRRFVNRRGVPIELHSDNGTNFHGAERILRQQIYVGLSATFTNASTTWRFIPPGAPHMGGCWERMVRSVKSALSTSYGDEKLDDEAFQTLLVEAESIVNSRPLTYLPLQSTEHVALTPNHFLLGSSSGVTQPSVQHIGDANELTRSWRTLQKQLDRFWKRWVREYMPWFGKTKNIQPGELVLIIDDRKRNQWTRGGVLEVITAADGAVRQVIVQTSGGILRRPSSKLAVLEFVESDVTSKAEGSIGGRMLPPQNTPGNPDELGSPAQQRQPTATTV
ncbi:uncharacterized protein LOC129772938 [Toxorhynchites rutilus septentrionalis]|uniref:uncharacterized protein LOC129772938 n=1 Tax=Toxorhynchites rutilus septentrionalis TaxID=329112 RepID=UPI002479BCCB|nr:uncharacterized protein LOC129772938 [Toxorhynchites rutilus septentrionalis]